MLEVQGVGRGIINQKQEEKTMEKELAKKPNVLEMMASKYNLGHKTFLQTLKATVMKPDKNGKVPTDEEVAAFLLVASKYDLNPFTKEIYAFPDKRAGIIPIVGLDGFITLANRHPQYDGYEITWADKISDISGCKPCPEWCEVKVFRKDRAHPVVVREYLDEVYQEPRSGFKGPWQTHTKRMLRHKTLIQGFRVAFGLTGIYDEDEAIRIVDSEVIDMPTTASKPDVDMPKAIEAKQDQDGEGEWSNECLYTDEDKDEAPVGPVVISEAQRKRLYAIAKGNGYSVSDINAYIGAYHKVPSMEKIPVEKYDEIVKRFEVKKDAPCPA